MPSILYLFTKHCTSPLAIALCFFLDEVASCQMTNMSRLFWLGNAGSLCKQTLKRLIAASLGSVWTNKGGKLANLRCRDKADCLCKRSFWCILAFPWRLEEGQGDPRAEPYYQIKFHERFGVSYYYLQITVGSLKLLGQLPLTTTFSTNRPWNERNCNLPLSVLLRLIEAVVITTTASTGRLWFWFLMV